MPNGMMVSTVSLTTPITNTAKAFLLVDSSGPMAAVNGRDHMVSGYISDANMLTFERMGSTGQAEVSYALVECFYNEFTVQRGEIQLANGVVFNTAAVNAVDPAKSFVIVNSRTNIAVDQEHQGLVTGELVDSTTVQVERATAATGATTNARYEVVTFDAGAGVDIQTGEVAFNGGQFKTITLPQTVNVGSSWLYFSYDATDDGPQQTAIGGQITANNKVTFYRHESSTYVNRIRYYVIEFPVGQVTVQGGTSIYLGGASATVTHNIPITPVSAVDKAFTFVTNTTMDKDGSATVDPNGTYIEAEKYTSEIAGTGTLTSTTRGGEIHSGTSLLTGSGSNGNCDTVSTRAGREYMVNFPVVGTYNIWMRGFGNSTSSNTLFVGFYSGIEPANGCIVDLRESTYGVWVWTKNMQSSTGPGGVNPLSARFTVNTPGVYPLRIWISESNHYVDGFYLDSVGKTPTDASHGIVIDPTAGTANTFPRNRWVETLSSASNIQMSQWRGDSAGADTDFHWQVIEFTGSPGGGGGSDLKVKRHYSSTYTDPTTGSLLDVKCVECHNPMSTQSNLAFVRSSLRGRSVVFTAYSGANSFADGDATYNGVCEVCHTQTNFHRYDGSEPIHSHNNGKDCRLCHQHINGYQPVVEPAAPHNAPEFIANCAYCHVSAIDFGTKIPDAKCNQCHTPAGAMKASYPTAPNVLTHNTANGSGSYTYSNDCVDCHNPMWSQANLQLIRPTLTGSIVPGSNIDFTAYTGAGSFADGPPHNENVCETCHSLTNHHQSDGTAPGGQSHNDGLDCAACHPHSSAFLPTENNCVACHNQSPPFTSSDPNRRQIVEGIPGDGNGDFVKTSHHIVAGPSSLEVVTPDTCRICHDQSQHQTFGDGVSVLLNNQDSAGSTYTYNGTPASLEPFCLGCHDSNGSLVNGSQPFIGAGDTNSPANIGWKPGISAHRVLNSCFNCHGNTGTVNAHGSDNAYLNNYTFVPGQSNLFCYNCHNGSVSSKNVEAAFNLPFNHRAGNEECKSCHNQHRAESGRHVEGSTNLADMIGGVNKGMGFNYQYEICFQCHNASIIKTNTNSEGNMDTVYAPAGTTTYRTYWSNIPNVQSQFATTNLAYHPLLAAGKNQPADNLNSNWSSNTYRKLDTAPGGPFNGLDNNFVDGWRSTSLVTCTDCHDNNEAAGARGIHGSNYAWLLKAIDKTTAVKVTTAGSGTIYPNTSAPTNANSTFCANCHRSDIYGWGSSSFPSLNNQVLARWGHRSGSTSDQRQYSQGGGYRNSGCFNCHGGGEVAGIHGSNRGVGTVGTWQLGKRFMNGNSWNGHTASGTSMTCYTGTPPGIGVNMSGCSGQHTGSGRSGTLNYNY